MARVFDVEKALADGVDPQKIQAYMLAKGLKAKRGVGTAPKKEEEKEGFRLTDLLPTAGAIGGGILGAPFGGIPGIIAGSAIGGGLGKGAEQLFEGDDLNIGDIGKEAALSGALGGIGGGVGRLLGGGALKAGGAAARGAGIASKSTIKSFKGQENNSKGQSIYWKHCNGKS